MQNKKNPDKMIFFIKVIKVPLNIMFESVWEQKARLL